ncbi:GntR family transcriptional regulator [Luethyella okanaganae]|uniref:GntR family transcriptional regulator n=1 Tax=Luethyella okanaganae TaxID=69372 RepID=A0ABW1VGP2_9MICO
MDARDAAGRLAEQMRDDLTRGVFMPRERLVESELVQRYSCARAAVREALVLLSADGLVERLPNRGAHVRGLTVEEAIEIAEVRLALESLCSSYAALRATEEDRVALSRHVRAMADAVASDSPHRYRSESVEFHECLMRISRHESMTRELRSIRRHNLQRHFPAAFEAGSFSDSLNDHVTIADAILARDGVRAHELMTEHLGRIIAMLTAYRSTLGQRLPLE